MENTKWVSTWANATSIITRQVENYTKDITLRYPIKSAFKGSKLRFGFSNFCGTESITITGATVAKSDEKGNLLSDTTAITFKGKESVTIEKGIEINRNLDGFVFDENRNCWVRNLEMTIQPVTYIYLTQIILHNNRQHTRIVTGIDGSGNLSGMARSVNLNTGVTGRDAITVNYNMRMKFDQQMKDGEKVDIIGGRVLTFGMPKLNPSRLDTRSYIESLTKVRDADLNNRHYLDVKMQFYNGKDSTLVFDVTDQVRKLFRGGVITIDLDMTKVPVPVRPGGSGFDAVVKDFEEKQWEFDM